MKEDKDYEENQMVNISIIYINDYHDWSKNEIFRENNVRRWQYFKYKWYWHYLLCLAQVKRPKATVNRYLSFYYPDTKSEAKDLKNKISAAKRMITQLNTGIEELKKEYKKELFPEKYTEDPLYQKAVCKLGEYKIKLYNLEEQIKSL
jgi:hypothetical protein